jgi:hypothetical protein
MFSRTCVALCVAALTFAGVASAQENATITLRSGEKLSAQLVDLGGNGFTVRVNGQDRQLPTNDVAAIDFTAGTISQSDWDKVSGGQHVLVLKSGQAITGQFTDVGGTSPLRISFKTDSGDRDFNSSEVSRILMARPNNVATATTGSTNANSAQGITVSGTQQWAPTGIVVRRGDWVTFNASGEVRIGGPGNPTASPAGVNPQTSAPGAPMQNAPAGALIGKVGNSAPFLIGTQQRVRMTDSGQLFLGVNDGHLEDNEGGFQVTVQREGNPIR